MVLPGGLWNNMELAQRLLQPGDVKGFDALTKAARGTGADVRSIRTISTPIGPNFKV